MASIQVPLCSCFADKSIEHINALLDDKGASLSIDQANWSKEYPYKPLTWVYLARTDQKLLIKWHVVGVMLKAIYTHDGDAVFNDSCVEFFCKLPDSERYYNLEFNAIGTARCASRISRNESVEVFSEEQYKQIERYSSLGRRPFCEIDGQFVWDLCVAIPLPLLGIDNAHLPEYIEGNFYKCADDTSAKHYLSWSAIKTAQPDFHRPEFFGKIYF
ncbi:MAG: hypothetical protein IJ834_01150 [Paludibacteraceae bacterium]|nr:hypothetical protein [Paludibacteraceae bacterium]